MSKAIKADSVVMFIRDPWWQSEMRLLAMDGVSVIEPMHGFLPSQLLEELRSSPSIQSLRYSKKHRGNRPIRDAQLRTLSAENRVYGTFIDREAVVFAIRAVGRRDEEPVVVVYANFRSTPEPEAIAAAERKMQAFVEKFCGGEADAVLQELRHEPLHVNPLFSVLGLAEKFSPIYNTPADGGPESLFQTLLQALWEGFELDDADVATVYLLSKDGLALERAALLASPDANPNLTQPLEEGVLGWVALLERGLLIEDLDKSPFKGIYEPTEKDAQSLIAVPMVVGGQLVGTVSLESGRKRFFRPECLRVLWHASHLVAVAYRLHLESRLRRHQENSIKDVSEMVSATTGGGGLAEPLHSVATLACSHLAATRCDIWLAGEGGGWTLGGSSDASAPPASPRADGWTRFAADNRIAIQIVKTGKAAHEFSWNAMSQSLHWQKVEIDTPTPATINVSGMGGSRRQMAVPCVHDGGVSAVIWLSFSSPSESVNDDQSRWIDLLTSCTNIVVKELKDSLRKAEAARTAEVSQQLAAQLKQTEFHDPVLKIGRREAPRGANIGGDCISVSYDPTRRRLMSLVCDAEGHGLPGALMMLPIVTAYRMLQRECGSPRHLVERMFEMEACMPGSRGTAMCFSIHIDTVDPTPRVILTVTSAGHHPLLLAKNGVRLEWVPDPDTSRIDAAAAGPMIGVQSRWSAGETSRELVNGDILVAYTDGIEDAAPILDAPTPSTAKRESFGRGGIYTAVLGATSKKITDPQKIADAVYDAAVKHAGRGLSDDASVLVICVDSKSAPKGEQK